MAAKQKALKKLKAGKVRIIKLKNRRGYAAVCSSNLTEGRTAVQAFSRMVKAVKRQGYALTGKAPKPKKTF